MDIEVEVVSEEGKGGVEPVSSVGVQLALRMLVGFEIEVRSSMERKVGWIAGYTIRTLQELGYASVGLA